MAGDHFAVYEDEKSARAAGEEHYLNMPHETTSNCNVSALKTSLIPIKLVNSSLLTLSSKADVQVLLGAASLQKIDVEGVKVTIIHSAVSAILDPDVTLAEASKCLYRWF